MTPLPNARWSLGATIAALATVAVLGALAGGIVMAAPATASTSRTPSTSTTGTPQLSPDVGHLPSRADRAALAFSTTPSPVEGRAANTAPANDLVITTPSRIDMVYFVHGPRTVTISGRAPVGSLLTVHDGNDEPLATTAPDPSGSFTVTLTFSDAVSWDQTLVIGGRSGTRTLTEQLVEVQFDAPDTTVPVVTEPGRGTILSGSPAPFGGGYVTVVVSGTAKPGDQVFVDADPSDTSRGADRTGSSGTAAADGIWAVHVRLAPGSYTFTPVAQTIDDTLGPLSGYTDGTSLGPVDCRIADGSVIPPVVTEPISVVRNGSVFTAKVSGTGTPGTGIQLYEASVDEAGRYFAALYPGWFDDSTAAPSVSPPTYDGRVVVAADGDWSTQIPVRAGANVVGAFTVDIDDPDRLRYSVVSNDPVFDTARAVDSPPAQAPSPGATTSTLPATNSPASLAAHAELAHTGSSPLWAALLALGLLIVGSFLRIRSR